ncbi:MAG: hypothetical protein AB8G05_10575 [Oligoflexales bacterium]
MERISKKNRFRCFIENDRVAAHGIMTDTTNFFMLDDLLEETLEISLKDVDKASWIGLVNFCKYLNNKKKKFILFEVPYRIFRHMRLLTKYIQELDVKSIYIDLYLLENLEQKDCDRLISNIGIQALKQQGPCLTGDSRKMFIPEPIEYLNLDSCKKGVKVNFHPALKWTKEEFDELIFWYKLQKFTAETIDLVQDMHRTQNFQIFNSLEKIRQVIMSFEMVFDTQESIKTKEFKDFENWFSREMLQISNVLNKIYIKSDFASRVIFFHLFFDKVKISKSIHLKILDSSSEIVEFVRISSAVEGLGSKGTKHFIKMDLCKYFHELLDQAASNGMLEKKYEEITDKFNILDLTAQEENFDLKVFLKKAVDSIDDIMVEEIVTYFQGFDLLNQVIHHRFNEAEYVIDCIDRIQEGKMKTEDFQSSILKRMQESLVTDQENSTFNFFFPTESS